MAPKKQLPAPIDRPLSKAYLRKFTGWSTAYPPGMSEPTSMRVMHNCNLVADGSIRIRPGLRRVLSAPAGGNIVGAFEHFFTSAGVKALLFAIRRTSDNAVIFRVAVENSGTGLYDVQADIATQFPGATDESLKFASTTTYVKYLQIDNKILALSDNTEPFRMFWVGATRKAKPITAVTRPNYDTTDWLSLGLPVSETPPAGTVPTLRPDPTFDPGTGAVTNGAATPLTPTSLIARGDNSSNDATNRAKNTYNLAYYYTFNNEIGETAPSMARQLKVQRRLGAWQDPDTDDTFSTDQIACIIPSAVYTAAIATGAVSWNLYFTTWSDQEAVPVEGLLLRTVQMYVAGTAQTHAQAGWALHTALLAPDSDVTKMLPSAYLNRDNFSDPSKAGNGIVAGDRLILVHDRVAAARIQWSSNQLGDYINFSSAVGGGYKTLTSGNLMHPACVKLWQNPQSVDTLTVLCQGIDGYGTAYYMNPGAGVSTQTQSAVLMGFEETTATPGTVSPYGNEVLNNALYHTLDNNLMKSSASNYNITHLMMADKIQNVWHQIPAVDKAKIVSSQMDMTLYYLVSSPVGWLTDDEANGNQVWLCDTALSGAWSCWDVKGSALQKLELGGLLYMAIVSGPSIFVFDPEQDRDDVWNGTAYAEAGIAWEIITNTQGANRAHDAWCLLQQVNVTFGNFTGECVYGIRGKDVNGMPIVLEKHFVSPVKGHDPLDRYDQADFLMVRRGMVEWEFFWRSADRPKNRSYGSVNFVQYRYTPISVNVGYEYGSIETFEYGSTGQPYVNGTPTPFADTGKP